MITLFDSQMGVNGGITGSSSEVFAFSVGDVLAIPLDVPFGESEIQNEDLV